MTRNIFVLTRHPELYNPCVDAIVEYIREKHPSAKAIVAPDTKGFLFATNVASKLDLPFIPIRKAGKLPDHSGDLIRTSFINRMKKVNFCRKIRYYLSLSTDVVLLQIHYGKVISNHNKFYNSTTREVHVCGTILKTKCLSNY